jgi:hypothetical protein
MGSLRDYTIREFQASGWLKEDGSYKDEMQEMICKNMLDIIEIFEKQGHTNSTSSYVIGHLTQLLKYEPIAPLTGEDSEWNSINNDKYQNKRCSHVFKEGKDGKAYDSEAIVFYNERSDGSKSHFVSRDSIQFIEFPYTPKPKFVKSE